MLEHAKAGGRKGEKMHSGPRKRDTGARMDALIRGADWAPMGASDPEAAALSSEEETVVAQKGLG